MGLSFTIAAGLASAVILRSESRGTHYHILLPQIRDSPNLEGQVPEFISPRNKVSRLYPQALGSLFVASYDSQGYGGGIRTRNQERIASRKLGSDTGLKRNPEITNRSNEIN
jgi:hypothetical protein